MKNKTAQISISFLVIFCLSVFIPSNGLSVTKYSKSIDYEQVEKKGFVKKNNSISTEKIKKKKHRFAQKIKSFFQKIVKQQKRIKDGKKKIPVSAQISLGLLLFGGLGLILAFAAVVLPMLAIAPLALILAFFFGLGANETITKNPDKYDFERTKKIWRAAWITMLILLAFILILIVGVDWSECCF